MSTTEPAVRPEKALTNSLGMAFALIEPGRFAMGAVQGYAQVRPVHPVTLTTPFYLGTCTVTQAQWTALMGTTPWQGQGYTREGDAYPALHVSWDDAQAFIAALNAREEGARYRLPTEAEWEYACRAGTTTAFYFGDAEEALADYGWYYGNANASGGEDHAQPVGLKTPNAWGLFDMHGNVWEWTADWYGPYPAEPLTDPAGPATGKSRVVRGGSWSDPADFTTSANRVGIPPEVRDSNLGFRLVRAVR